MSLLLTIVVFIGIVLLFRFARGSKRLGLHPWLIPSAFAIKCLAGFVFFQFYIFQQPEAHLNNDAGTFLHEGKILNHVFYESPSDYFKFLTGIGENEELIQRFMMETDHWSSGDQSIINDNKNIIRVHSLIYFFSMDSPWIHLFVFCALSLIGLCLLFQSIQSHSKVHPTLIFGLLLVLPSTLYWSSAIIKEPFLILGLGLFAHAFLVPSKIHKRLLFGVLGLWLLLSFKPYVLVSLFPGIIGYVVYQYIPKYKAVLTAFSLVLMAAVSVLLFPRTVDSMTHVLSRKQFDFSNVGRGGMHVKTDTCFYYFSPEQYDQLSITGDSIELTREMDAWIVQYGSLVPPQPVHLAPTGEKWLIYFQNPRAQSYIEIPAISDSKTRLVQTIPSALSNALLRPFPTDPGSSLKYIVFLETVFIFCFLIWAILKRRKLNNHHKGLIVCLLVFGLLLALLIGWVTPVLGAIIRYRIPIHLAILFIGLILVNRKYITHGD